MKAPMQKAVISREIKNLYDLLDEAARIIRTVEYGDSGGLESGGYCPYCGASGEHMHYCILGSFLRLYYGEDKPVEQEQVI